MCGASLTHPVLDSFLSGEFLLHIPWCVVLLLFCFLFFCLWNFSYTQVYFILFYFNLGSFSYTSRVAFFYFLFFLFF